MPLFIKLTPPGNEPETVKPTEPAEPAIPLDPYGTTDAPPPPPPPIAPLMVTPELIVATTGADPSHPADNAKARKS